MSYMSLIKNKPQSVHYRLVSERLPSDRAYSKLSLLESIPRVLIRRGGSPAVSVYSHSSPLWTYKPLPEIELLDFTFIYCIGF